MAPADLAAVKADADSADTEAKRPPGVEIELATSKGTATLLVPPPGTWGTRATRDLNAALLEEWAEAVLSEDDYTTWYELDPSNDDAADFINKWRAAVGEDPGKSRASRRSSKSTARR